MLGLLLLTEKLTAASKTLRVGAQKPEGPCGWAGVGQTLQNPEVLYWVAQGLQLDVAAQGDQTKTVLRSTLRTAQQTVLQTVLLQVWPNNLSVVLLSMKLAGQLHSWVWCGVQL